MKHLGRDPQEPEELPDDFYGEGGCWAKCAACGITFTSVTGFDDHRYGSHEHDTRRCRTPEQMQERGYEPNDAGHWRKPLKTALEHWN